MMTFSQKSDKTTIISNKKKIVCQRLTE